MHMAGLCDQIADCVNLINTTHMHPATGDPLGAQRLILLTTCDAHENNIITLAKDTQSTVVTFTKPAKYKDTQVLNSKAIMTIVKMGIPLNANDNAKNVING